MEMRWNGLEFHLEMLAGNEAIIRLAGTGFEAGIPLEFQCYTY